MSNTTTHSDGETIITIDSDKRDGLRDTAAKLFSALPTPFRKQNPAHELAKLTVKDISKCKKRRIGGGGFGDVYRLSHPQMGEIVLKQLRLSRSSETAQDQRRVRVLVAHRPIGVSHCKTPREHSAKV